MMTLKAKIGGHALKTPAILRQNQGGLYMVSEGEGMTSW